MFRIVPPIAGVVLVATSAIIYGIQTDRVRDPEVLDAASARLATASAKAVEGWSATNLTLEADQLRAAEAAGGAAVRYSRLEPATDGTSTIDMMLLCGPHGPISVHPPTVCFKGVGYQQCATSERVNLIDGDGHSLGTFWVTEFERPVDGITQRIRTYWAWSSDGNWSAPDNPRAAFAGVPVLYKLYLTEQLISAGDEPESREQVVQAFAQQFLPQLKAGLFPRDSSIADPATS